MNRLQFVLVALNLLLVGCKPATDLNAKCTLVKANPDGGSPVPILEGEVRNVQGQNKDFISSGSTDCDDLTCVRDSFFTSDASADSPAMGYCSRNCVQGTKCLSQDEKLDKGSTALRCRPLLLSAETLALLAAGDGGFVGLRDTFFCARGIVDGGM